LKIDDGANSETKESKKVLASKRNAKDAA
ncbi:MAG: hypothetical protein ACI81V_001423, partial [Lentimonas sp.]